MKGFYLLFAAGVFAMFCFLEFRGSSWDTSHRAPKPKYYSYRGGSSSTSYYGSSRSSYSHK